MKNARRRSIWLVVGLLVVAFVVRVGVAPHQGHKGDEAANQDFCVGMLKWGFGFYQKTDYQGSCYPPAMMYVLGAAGAVWTRLGGTLTPGSLAFRLLIKSLPILADLGILLVVYFVFLTQKPLRQQLLYGGLIALHPVMIYDSAIWGQFEALVMLPLIGAVVAGQRGRPYLSLGLGALAALMKLQALVAFPLLLIICYQQVKLRRTTLALLAAVILVIALTAPFLIGTPVTVVVGKLLGKGTGENISFTSLNAFNIWALVGFFEDQYQQWAGLSYLAWGSLLGGASYLWACWVQWRSGGLRTAQSSANSVAPWVSLTLAYLGLFVFMTMMHERYIYYPVVLATIWLIHDTRVLRVWLVLAAVGTLNMHYRLRIPNWGLLHALHGSNITVYSGMGLNLISWVALGWLGWAGIARGR